jgi:hypothetical protein
MQMDKAIEQLQAKLGLIDLLTQETSRSGYTEFLVTKKQNLKIKMYKEPGHYRPNIHIDYGSHNHAAMFSLSDGKKLRGNLDRKYEESIVSWIAEHQIALNELWVAVQSGNPVEEILVGIKNI